MFYTLIKKCAFYQSERVQGPIYIINSGVRLLLELYCVVFFNVFAKLLVTMAFTFRFSDVIVVSDLNKNFGGSTDLAKKGTDWWICIVSYSPPP